MHVWPICEVNIKERCHRNYEWYKKKHSQPSVRNVNDGMHVHCGSCRREAGGSIRYGGSIGRPGGDSVKNGSNDVEYGGSVGRPGGDSVKNGSNNVKYGGIRDCSGGDSEPTDGRSKQSGIID